MPAAISNGVTFKPYTYAREASSHFCSDLYITSEYVLLLTTYFTSPKKINLYDFSIL